MAGTGRGGGPGQGRSRAGVPAGATSVFACVCDLNGTLRGKRHDVRDLDKLLDGGARLPLSIAGVDVWGGDVAGSELVFGSGDADGVGLGTGRAPVPVTWTSSPTALVPLWLFEEGGEPFAGDPRQGLARAVEGLAAHGLTAVVATELEFYLVDPSGRVPRPPRSPLTGRRLGADDVLSLDGLEHFGAFFDAVHGACEAAGVPTDTALAENGAGQFEINLRHVDDALRAADDAVLFKRIVRGVARRHGLAATFMAKPFGGRSGSGLHVHCSLVDAEGRNAFDDGGEAGTATLRHAVAGALRTMAENALAFAPHLNSWRRLTPGAHAPTSVAWGRENRTVAVRVPGGDPGARRLEHRVAGADANPYLVIATALDAMRLGIEGRWEPPEPVTGDAYALAGALPALPGGWAAAIDAFAAADPARATLPPRLRAMLVDAKRQELARFDAEVTELEYRSYLESV